MVRDILGNPDAATGADYWHEHVLEKVIGKDTAARATKRLLSHFGPIEVRKLQPADVAAYVRRRRDGWPAGVRCGNAVIRRDLGVLVAAINHAIRARRLPASEAPAVALPEAPEAKDRWLTQEEAYRLLAACMHGWKPGQPLPRVFRFAAIALFTASRKTAILELTKDQVDMQRGVIRLNPAGRRQTKKKRPAVPISNDLRPILERVMADLTGYYLLDHPGAIRTAWESATARAGMPEVTPHTLRHTWACWAAQAGVSMVDIAGVLGDSVQTVINHYLHHSPEHLRSAVNAIGRRAA